jgi:hypothetical protein
MTDYSLGSFVASASSETIFATAKAWMAFDGTLSTFWASMDNANQTLQIDLGQNKSIQRVDLRARNDSFYSTQSPKIFTFQGSLNGSTFTDLSSTYTITDWTQGGLKTFDFTPATARYIRLNCASAISSSSPIAVTEMEVWGT